MSKSQTDTATQTATGEFRIHGIANEEADEAFDQTQLLMYEVEETEPIWIGISDMTDQARRALSKSWPGNRVEATFKRDQSGNSQLTDVTILEKSTLSIRAIEETPEQIREIWESHEDPQNVVETVSEDGVPQYEIQLLNGGDDPVEDLWEDLLTASITLEDWYDGLNEIDAPGKHLTVVRPKDAEFLFIMSAPDSTPISVVHSMRSFVGEIEFACQ